MTHSLLVSDGLWAVLEPLLPERPARRVGRPRVDDRVALTAILFVLLTGLPWRLVPDEIGCSGVTAWRRLRDWRAAGVWAQLHHELLRRLNATGQLDWSVGVVDGSHIRALRGGSWHRRHRGKTRPASPSARPGDRRPRLRPRQVPPRTVAPRRQAGDRAPLSMVRDSDAYGGLWSVRLPGCTTSADSASAGNATPVCTARY
jgi:transposase